VLPQADGRQIWEWTNSPMTNVEIMLGSFGATGGLPSVSELVDTFCLVFIRCVEVVHKEAARAPKRHIIGYRNCCYRLKHAT